jgi:hypothetical protein
MADLRADLHNANLVRADLRAEAKQSKNKALFAMSDKIRTSLAPRAVPF